MKLEKMKAAVSGEYIPVKRAAEVYGAVLEAGMPQDFVDGCLFALGFLTCPAKEAMHGAAPDEFLENYLRNKAADEVPPEVLSAAQELIEQLKANGIHVVECQIVRGDR